VDSLLEIFEQGKYNTLLCLCELNITHLCDSFYYLISSAACLLEETRSIDSTREHDPVHPADSFVASFMSLCHLVLSLTSVGLRCGNKFLVLIHCI